MLSSRLMQRVNRRGFNSNPKACKLTDDQVREIRARYWDGDRIGLGTRYGVSRNVINRVVRGLSYQHVGGMPVVERTVEEALTELIRAANVVPAPPLDVEVDALLDALAQPACGFI